MQLKKFLFILGVLVIIFVRTGFAQESYTLQILTKDQKEKSLIKKSNYKTSLNSSFERHNEIRRLLHFLYDQGYIAANIDSTKKDSLHLDIYLNIGNRYYFANISRGNVVDLLLDETGYKEKIFTNTPFRYNELSKLYEQIITYCENNGYPFASIKLDSIIIDSNSFSACLNLNKNIKIIIDSIILKGDAKIAIIYLYNYFGIKPSDLYNESRISKIRTKIDELPFIKEIKPFVIGFTDKNAKIFIYAENKKASQFDGILGVLPNNETSGKLMLTGDIRLKLLNSFNRGELIDFNWKSLEQNTQDLNLHFVFPFVFSTPFGIDYIFSLYKKDTTYLNLNNIIGIQYLFKGNNFIKVFVDNQKSSLLSTAGMGFITALPNYADISTTLFGLEYLNQKLDYLLNPRKGHQFKVVAAAGNKKISKNININETLYDSLELHTTQYKLSFNGSLFVPLIKRATLLMNFNSGMIANTNLFENELFRIGGLKTLRGFDEESIRASFYSILTFEFRYLLDQNSYINIFVNGAYYEKKIVNSFICDRPYGFGAGLNFQTKAGIFSINYALGKQFDNPVDLKSAKIHFGIVSVF